jgi:stringent starvation protein B
VPYTVSGRHDRGQSGSPAADGGIDRAISYSRVVSNSDRTKLVRLQEVLSALLEHKLKASLETVEGSLRRWRQGELGPFEAHTELLEHTARVGRMAKRVARANPEMLRSILRESFDAGLVARDEFVDLVGEEPEAVPASHSVDDDGAWSAQKRKLVQQLLEQGPILVHIDARADGVEVPEQFRHQARLVLRFGYRLSPPIVDLDVGEEAIRGTLTFGGQPFPCAVPWSALYAVIAESDGQGTVWPEDVPDEILEELGMASSGASGSQPAPKAAKAAAPPPPDKPTKQRANHLKLVD